MSSRTLHWSSNPLTTNGGKLIAATVAISACFFTICIVVQKHDVVAADDFGSVASKASNRPIVLPQVVVPAEQSLANHFDAAGKMRRVSAGQLELSLTLHLMRLHGKDFEIPLAGTTPNRSVIEILCDEELGERAFGSSPIMVTDWGVRYEEADSFGRKRSAWRSAEGHRDQALAVMAEMGVPLSQPIVTKIGGQFTVRDVLRDSLAQFHLDQKEIAWTAFAYCLYLPPETEWTNRHGEHYSLEDVANAVLSRPLANESCSGMHIVAALRAMSIVASNTNIVTADTERRINARLDDYLSLAIKTQTADGSWNREWWDNELAHTNRLYRTNAADDELRIIATSHLLEWLHSTPEGVPAMTKLRASHWLLLRVQGASDEEMIDQYCGYSHACAVLRDMNSSDESPAGM
jgi:hypothetical protein